jgi:hypothetical protein
MAKWMKFMIQMRSIHLNLIYIKLIAPQGTASFDQIQSEIKYVYMTQGTPCDCGPSFRVWLHMPNTFLSQVLAVRVEVRYIVGVHGHVEEMSLGLG